MFYLLLQPCFKKCRIRLTDDPYAMWYPRKTSFIKKKLRENQKKNFHLNKSLFTLITDEDQKKKQCIESKLAGGL